MDVREGNVKWIDIQNPTPQELEALRIKFGFHEVILEELKVPSVRSHIEIYDTYVFFVYNFPVYDPKEQTSRRAEVDFLITHDAVITTRYEPLAPLFEIETLLASHPFELLYTILQKLLHFEERQLRHIREKIDYVSDELFRGREMALLERISRLKRDISEYRIIVRSGEGILNSLKEHGPRIWGEDTKVYLNDLAGDHLKIMSQIEDYRETISDFELTNSYLMSDKTNRVMKTFTILSFLTFPFVLFVSVLSMNMRGNPLLEVRNGFWYIAGAVVAGIGSLALYFRGKDWI
jgi:magnesium transporter